MFRFYGAPQIAFSRDGSGNYSLPQATFVSGTTIESAKVNSNFSDIASALTASLAKDGQTTPTANLPMGGYKHTGVGTATATTHYARADQVIASVLDYAADTGTATAYAIAPSPGIAAYVVGQRFAFKATNANSGADPTLAVNGLTAGIIYWPNGVSLAAGDIPASAQIVVQVATVAAGTPTFHLQTPTVPRTFTISPTTLTVYGALTPQGRLSLTSGASVMTANVTGATAIYYTPHIGNLVPLYDGTGLKWTAFTELTNTTTDATKNPAAVTTNSNYDLFVWSDSGTLRLGRGPAWTSDTARGTGAGTTELERVNGIWLNKVAITNGPAANRGTYVGTVRSDGSSQINWHVGAVGANGTAAILGVWNAYNRVEVSGLIGDSTDSWSYATATIRPANNSATMRASFVTGLQQDYFSADYAVPWGCDTNNQPAIAAVGFNSTTAFSGRWASQANPTGVGNGLFVLGGTHRVQTIGWNYMQALEKGTGTGIHTWYGDAAGAYQNGLIYTGRF